MSVESGLSLQWARLEGEGLVRVIKTGSFEDALGVIKVIGEVVNRVGYEPNVSLEPGKVTVMIPEDTSGVYTKLAHELDAVL